MLMAESNAISNDSKKEVRTSELAIASFLIPLFLLLVWIIFFIFIFWHIQIHEEFPTLSNLFLLLVSFILSISMFLFAAPVFALMSIIKIKKSKGFLNGRNFAYFGLVMSFLEFGLLMYILNEI